MGGMRVRDAATIKEVKDFFHRMKESIDNNYACGKLTNRSIRNSPWMPWERARASAR